MEDTMENQNSENRHWTMRDTAILISGISAVLVFYGALFFGVNYVRGLQPTRAYLKDKGTVWGEKSKTILKRLLKHLDDEHVASENPRPSGFLKKISEYKDKIKKLNDKVKKEIREEMED